MSVRDLAQGEGDEAARNVLGEPLQPCSFDPNTGFFRDGHCHTCAQDQGSHTVCAIMTAEFLEFSKSRGNDLTTPMPQYDFPGLKPGDSWCLCAGRWLEAHQAGKAPKVNLEATNEAALAIVPREVLERYAR
jgi:uncharacterized protein